MLRNNILTFAIITVLAVSFTACGGSEDDKKDDKKKPKKEKKETPKETTVVEDQEMDFVIHSPLLIARVLKKAGLPFEDGITNDIANAPNYDSKAKRALAYGIYSGDIAYVTINEEVGEITPKIKVLRDLSEALGFSSVFTQQNLFSRFEANASNPDTLIDLISVVQENLEEYLLMENSNEFMYATIFTGAWVELMYVGTKVGGDNPDLGRILVEQMAVVKNLAIGLGKNPDGDATITQVAADLTAIKDLFDNFEAIKALPAEDDPDFSSLQFSDEELASLTTKIQEVRERLVNM